MGSDYQFIDIVLFALVAAFLIFRLRGVLGRRNGQRPPANDPFRRGKPPEAGSDKVIRLPERGEHGAEPAGEAAEEVAEEMPGEPAGPIGVEAGLTQIKLADPRFDENEFLSGARVAFEMILSAFADDDTETLKPYLSPEVFANFSRSIRDRRQARERLQIKLVGIRSADIVGAYMAGRTAHVTVKFVSEQITATYDENSELIEGDPNASIEVTDCWTFARDTRSSDPNWMLVATGSPE